ncbi:hypothetical protein [Rubritalea tangerina]|uniref:D-ribose pyranase n=1 Tax=Rubritalea tangerina TaxID=430798 RepID=A0ABW4Z686_9BACT
MKEAANRNHYTSLKAYNDVEDVADTTLARSPRARTYHTVPEMPSPLRCSFRFLYSKLPLLLLPLLVACVPPKTQQPGTWQETVDSEIATLGAYNWIVIAESAYPAPGRPEAHLLHSPTHVPATLNHVLQSIESQGHVAPRIYLPKEAFLVQESQAPGMNAYRNALKKSLDDRPSQMLTSRMLESLMKGSTSGNRVLIIKTQTALPYTSVYIELESGYWDGESESALRQNSNN